MNNYVARASIQKAVRRGWADLAEETLAVLWEHDRAWLKWRLPIICAEDSFFSLPLLGKLQERIKDDDIEAVRELFSFMLSHKATQEGPELRSCVNKFAKDNPGIARHKEVRLYQFLLKEAGWCKEEESDRGTKVYGRAIYKLLDSPSLSEDVKEGIKAVGRRAFGGFRGDKEICLGAACVLVARCGDWKLKDFEEKLPKVEPGSYKEEGVELISKTPWVGYDMHTRIGKFVLRVATKKMLPKDRKNLNLLWWLEGSGHISEKRKCEVKLLTEEAPGPYDLIWCPLTYQYLMHVLAQELGGDPKKIWGKLSIKLIALLKWAEKKKMPDAECWGEFSMGTKKQEAVYKTLPLFSEL
jgi:hypothetical protein